VQRVAFILHDVFGYSFAEVAEITGRTPAACRQLASSACRRVRASQPPAIPAARQARIVRAFKAAWEARDINALAPSQTGPTRALVSHRIGRQIITDLRKREPGCYFRSWRAMIMRWIWLVPS